MMMNVTTRLRPSGSLRYGLTLTLLLIALGLTQAQSNRPASPTDPLGRQVRVALGHGDPDTAKRLAASQTASPASREFALALVEIYQGADDSARKRLEALVAAGGGGEAVLELGLLEIRHGQREAGRRRLEPLLSTQNLNTPDDYFLLARALRAVGLVTEDPNTRSQLFHLANSAYERLSIGRADPIPERRSAPAIKSTALPRPNTESPRQTSLGTRLEFPERWPSTIPRAPAKCSGSCPKTGARRSGRLAAGGRTRLECR
jgi:hypothetical protein